MKALNLTTLLLVIVGGLNWGLVGLFDFNLVAALFGVDSALTNLVYVLVGLSAIYQFVPFAQATSTNEVYAEGARRPVT
jgi:uncharacterized membrane protein YuzA (DUF378 family)